MFPRRTFSAAVDQQRSAERDHCVAILAASDRLDRYDADVRSRLRLSNFEHLAFAVDRIPFEQRMRHAHLVPPQIREVILRDIGHRLSGHQHDRES